MEYLKTEIDASEKTPAAGKQLTGQKGLRDPTEAG